MNDYRVRFDEKYPDKVFVPGVSFGYGIGSELPLLHRSGDYLVVKIPGSSDWSGIGETEYYGSEYLLCKLCLHSIGREGSGDYLKILERKQPGRFWAKTKRDFINKANQLATGKLNNESQQTA
jgi:hypothetical protein